MKKFFSTAARKCTEAIVAFVPAWLLFVVVFIALRFVEIALEWNAHGLPKQLGLVVAYGLLKDIAFVFTAGFWIFILYYLLFIVHKKAAGIFFIIAAILLSIIQLALSNYFVTTLVPLGADLWSYSLADIQQTLGAAGIKAGVMIGFVIAIVLFIFLFTRYSQSIKTTRAFAIVLVRLMLVAQLFQLSAKAAKMSVGSEQSNNLSVSKSDFFYRQTLARIFPEEPDIDIYADSYINDFGDAGNAAAKSFTYVDEANYPFLHKEDAPDVLAPFFDSVSKSTPPNIVIILTEGLGRAFTNTGAYLGNFTPFLDSLSQKSLYWQNFLSEGGRTFAVLPSVLGSLPFAKNGFCELADKAPDQLNLLNLMGANGYSSSFYYGGNSEFDFMNLFLKRSGIGAIRDIKTFPAGYTKMPASASGFSWGYGDKELFRYYLASNPVSAKPSLQVLLTVSTHSPFLINDQQNYLDRFEQRLTELGLDEKQKQEYRNYKLQYASILYTDDAFKNFFAQYAQRTDFKNTVFIITGDHRMPEIPMSTKADRYHVPLIIYSPLLKRTARFDAVSTHFDITPTLVAWLKDKYSIRAPANTSWMGTGIDTSHAFRSIHNYPFMQTKTGVSGFMLGTYFLDGEDLFELGNNMSLVPLQDDEIKSRVKAALGSFNRRNNSLINGGKLIPDSTYRQFVQ